MKKKTYIILGAAALLLVIGLILTILLCVKNDPATDDIIDTVEEAEEILVPAISETFARTTLPGEELPAFLKVMESLQTFEVLSVKPEEEDMVTVTLSVSAPNLTQAIETVNKQGTLSREEMDSAIEAAIKEVSPRKEEVTVIFYKLEGIWYPQITDTFFNACYGGVLEIYKDLLGGAN
ncbi:MAG: hypothetical protein J6S15_00320 [Clostridia bacterium]|nr:hypothetical protein [Clostridia bacterium]